MLISISADGSMSRRTMHQRMGKTGLNDCLFEKPTGYYKGVSINYICRKSLILKNSKFQRFVHFSNS